MQPPQPCAAVAPATPTRLPRGQSRVRCNLGRSRARHTGRACRQRMGGNGRQASGGVSTTGALARACAAPAVHRRRAARAGASSACVLRSRAWRLKLDDEAVHAAVLHAGRVGVHAGASLDQAEGQGTVQLDPAVTHVDHAAGREQEGAGGEARRRVRIHPTSNQPALPRRRGSQRRPGGRLTAPQTAARPLGWRRGPACRQERSMQWMRPRGQR